MSIKNLYPLKLKPVLKDAIWAGTRLASEYGKSNNPTQKIAESWELTAHKNGVNIIENGEYAGQTLGDLFKLDKSIVSSDYNSGKFPLLIKYIDAEQTLSVQVHPDNDYAQKYENGELGKTEMWYIVDCKPGAKIVYGLNGDYTREDLQNLIDCNKFEDCLNYIEVKPGDVYFIPAGFVHAIGGGILIAEVQQNSDTTYRLYDYNRLGADGNLRELHIKKALDVCIKTKTEYESPKKFYNDINEAMTEILTVCEYFKVFKVKYYENGIAGFTGYAFTSLICLDGEGEIVHGKNIYRLKKGDSYFLPAGMGQWKIYRTNEKFTVLFTNLGENYKK